MAHRRLARLTLALVLAAALYAGVRYYGYWRVGWEYDRAEQLDAFRRDRALGRP